MLVYSPLAGGLMNELRLTCLKLYMLIIQMWRHLHVFLPCFPSTCWLSNVESAFLCYVPCCILHLEFQQVLFLSSSKLGQWQFVTGGCFHNCIAGSKNIRHLKQPSSSWCHAIVNSAIVVVSTIRRQCREPCLSSNLRRWYLPAFPSLPNIVSYTVMPLYLREYRWKKRPR